MLHRKALFASSLSLALAGVALSAEPATRPVVPELGLEGKPRSFLLQGWSGSEGMRGLGFSVAIDGDRQRLAVFDASDGTPFFLSDGTQTLIYDLQNKRVVYLPHSYPQISVDWDEAAQKPLKVGFSVYTYTLPKSKDVPPALTLQFTKMIDSLQERWRRGQNADAKDGLVVYEAMHAPTKRLLRFDVDLAGGKSFRFAYQSADEGHPSFIASVTKIDQKIPDELLTFPDHKRFPEGVRAAEIDAPTAKRFIAALANGQAFVLSFTMCWTKPDELKKASPGTDWGEVQKTHSTLGAAYRKALNEQGVEFKPNPPAATQPAPKGTDIP